MHGGYNPEQMLNVSLPPPDTPIVIGTASAVMSTNDLTAHVNISASRRKKILMGKGYSSDVAGDGPTPSTNAVHVPSMSTDTVAHPQPDGTKCYAVSETDVIKEQSKQIHTTAQPATASTTKQVVEDLGAFLFSSPKAHGHIDIPLPGLPSLHAYLGAPQGCAQGTTWFIDRHEISPGGW